MDVTNTTVFVTGANRGLGLALARVAGGSGVTAATRPGQVLAIVCAGIAAVVFAGS
jgi:NAD(P)-dependent dehydrogenase (short-subunit alcohol dehydrogenase family)